MRAVVLVALILVAAPAAARASSNDGVHQAIGDQPAVLVIDAAWRTTATSAIVDPPALVMRHRDGALLAVTVAMAPNSEVYRTRKRAAWLADVIAGFEATEGVKVTKHKVGKVGVVHSIDLWLERRTDDGTEIVAVRLLLFRTRTISVAASGGSRKVLAAAIAALVPTSSL